jgi:hypothetical protein
LAAIVSAAAHLLGQRTGGQHIGLQFDQRQMPRHAAGKLPQAQEIRLLAGHAQFQHAMQRALQRLRLGLQLIALGEQRLGRHKQRFASPGQSQPPARPIKQRHAQALLERLDLRSDGRLGQ